MDIVVSLVIGYLFGCLNPAALLAKIKKKSLREQGTGNLGATNVMLVFGTFYGVMVMIFDVIKAVIAFKLAEALFPQSETVGLVAGYATILGHVFPFYMKFKGGKGLAAFSGMILAYSPLLFVILLAISAVLALIVNYSFIMPYSLSVLFCLAATIRSKSLAVFLITALVATLIMWKHAENVKKAKNGTDVKIREYIKEHFFR